MRGAPDPRPRTSVEVLAEILQVQGPGADLLEAKACEIARNVAGGLDYQAECAALSDPIGGQPLHLWLAAYYLRRPAQLQAWALGYGIEGGELMSMVQAAGERYGGLPHCRLNADTRRIRYDYPDGTAFTFERAPIWQPAVPGWPTQWPNSWRKLDQPELVEGPAFTFDGRPVDPDHALGPTAMEAALGDLFPWEKGKHFATNGTERAGAPADEGPIPTTPPPERPEAPTETLGARGELRCVTCPSTRVSGPALNLVARATSQGCPTCGESDTVIVESMGRVLYEGKITSAPPKEKRQEQPEAGEWTVEELEGKKKDQLRLICKEAGIKGFNRYSKAKLIEAIMEDQGSSG